MGAPQGALDAMTKRYEAEAANAKRLAEELATAREATLTTYGAGFEAGFAKGLASREAA